MGQRILAMLPLGKRRKGRPQRPYRGNIRENVGEFVAKETRKRQKLMGSCAL